MRETRELEKSKQKWKSFIRIQPIFISFFLSFISRFSICLHTNAVTVCFKWRISIYFSLVSSSSLMSLSLSLSLHLSHFHSSSVQLVSILNSIDQQFFFLRLLSCLSFSQTQNTWDFFLSVRCGRRQQLHFHRYIWSGIATNTNDKCKYFSLFDGELVYMCACLFLLWVYLCFCLCVCQFFIMILCLW